MTNPQGYSAQITERCHLVLDALENGTAPPAYEARWDWSKNAPGTDNHDAGVWAGEAARAATGYFSAQRVKDREHFVRAREVLLHTYFPREKAALWAREPMCPENHSHQHLQGSTMARVAAWVSKDPELMEASEELLRRTVAALRAVADPRTLFVASAGTRCHGTPNFWSATAFLRQACLGTPESHPLPEFKRNPDNWRYGQGIAVRPLRYLLRCGDPLMRQLGGVQPAGCPLNIPMTAYRWPGGHLAIMDKPDRKIRMGGKEFYADWVRVTYGADRYKDFTKAIEYGRNWTIPPPHPPKGAQVVEFTGWAGRAAA